MTAPLIASSTHPNITDLPAEILAQIFSYVYPPWHLRYTQEHDTHQNPPPSTDPSSQTIPFLHSISTLHGLPLFSTLPPLSPLLTCRTLHGAASPALAASFIRQVHIASRMIWPVIHPSYARIMAKARDLVIASAFNDSYELRSFLKLGMVVRFEALERIVVWIGEGGTGDVGRRVRVRREIGQKVGEGDGRRVEVVGRGGGVIEDGVVFGVGESDIGWITNEFMRRVFLPGFMDQFSSYAQLWAVCQERGVDLVWRAAWPASLRLEDEGEGLGSPCILVVDYSADFSDLLEPDLGDRCKITQLRLGRDHQAPS